MPERKTCLVPECKSPAASMCRGLCMKCYGDAKRAVESNQTTWVELESLGLVEAKPSTFFKALHKKQQERDS